MYAYAVQFKEKKKKLLKKEESDMAVLWFVLGLFIGCGTGIVFSCFSQINKLNYYENEIRRLRKELETKK